MALAGVAALVITVGQARAEMVFQQWPPSAPGRTSDLVAGQQIADDFTLGQAAQIDSVRWAGAYRNKSTPPPGVDFLVRFFFDASGVPAATPFYEASVDPTFSGFTIDGNPDYPAFLFTAALPLPPMISAATKTWLSIVESDTTTSSNFLWAHLHLESDPIAVWATDSTAWDDRQGTRMAFILEGNISAIPEPATFTTFGIGLACVAVGRAIRRRRRAA